MRRIVVGLLGLSLASGLGTTLGSAALAAPKPATPVSTEVTGDSVPGTDELPNPLEDKRRELREQGLTAVLNGERKAEQRGASTVVKVGQTAAGSRNAFSGRGKKDQYVELSRETTDRVFVILAEFGDTRHPSYPDQDTDVNTQGPATFEGPLVNSIPEPNRAVDNSTVWQPDYNREHYQEMYFGTGKGVESLKTYYETQSSGRYSVDGTVTDWVKVQYNEARYGRSNGYPCAGNVCSNTWALIKDAANQWYADQKALGRTDAEIAAELATFDKWDRYDFDGDGNFNEPDGYMDHFQIVHAGGDQADGDPQQGEDAIWSHRWYAYTNLAGSQGPAGNLLGGTQIGTSGLWIGDYTIQPENGGRSVFFHEFGHDLGLPDDYNITYGGDNNNEHWTLMAQSRLGAKGEQFIGDRAGDLGAWNKLQLGWLDYETLVAGAGVGGNRTLTLGPQEYNSTKAQALVVVLPKKEVVTALGAPAAGANQWWSGSGDDYAATLARQVTLPAGSASLSFQARYDIEDCGADACDYAYVEVDDGTGWKAIPGSIAKAAEGNGIDGTQAAWTAATFDLSAYAGKTVSLRIRYATDGAVAGNDPAVPNGIFVDEVAITANGSAIFSDGAENGANGWTAAGFSAVGTSISAFYDNYYIAGHRSYVSYDKYLKTGPYYFGYLNTAPDKVDHYAYQQGLLISYWDTSYADNDTFAHPGSGRNLYIDAHPVPLYNLNGVPWRSRVQVYDAPFSLTRADSFTLHINGVANHIRGQAAQPLFDDTKTYWYAELPNHGVILPAAGVKIRVLDESGTSIKIRVTS
ncbi:MAG: M6 family metalloprotease domain-containing protein [Hamadaea sp.]|nr:M6 family metalloprotease domain-containing protein [Hamadaea sp.]NUT07635.1 M6 family metalloprotease domain-containing protein [Hamadaea sp.]